MALGLLKEDSDRMRKMIAYLEKYERAITKRN